MTDTETNYHGGEGDSTAGDTRAAIDAGVTIGAAEPKLLMPGQQYAMVVPAGGRVAHLNLDKDEYRPRPRRKTGTVYVHTADAFLEYLGKHGTPETEVWSDTHRQQLVAVINAHGPGSLPGTEMAGWGDHRCLLVLHKTPAWEAWEAQNKKLLSQTEFAEHIEDRSIDVVEPEAAVMLEIAQTFHANSRVSYESSQRLSTGERQFEFRETTDAKAGPKGDVTIPETFKLGLAPFEGCNHYAVVARLRYRIAGGELRIGYALERPEDILRAAYEDVVDGVASGDQMDGRRPILSGTPGR